MRHGADVTVKDNMGRTTLDLAVEGGHHGVIELLQKLTGTARPLRRRNFRSVSWGQLGVKPC